MYNIVFNNIKKFYGRKQVLFGLTGKFESDKVYAVAGSNGSGKSTFLKILSGIITSDEGEVNYYKDNEEYHNSKKIIAYQLQNISNIFRGLKVWEAIYYTGILRGLGKEKSISEMRKLIEYFNIEHISEKILMYLSGGEKQLTSICMTFIGDLPIIILDEPTNNLDPERKILLSSKINEYKKKGKMIIIVTHELSELESVIDNLIILKEGRIILDKKVDDILPQESEKVKITIDDIDSVNKKIMYDIKEMYNVVEEDNTGVIYIPKCDLESFITKYNLKFINYFSINISNITLQDKYLIINREEN